MVATEDDAGGGGGVIMLVGETGWCGGQLPPSLCELCYGERCGRPGAVLLQLGLYGGLRGEGPGPRSGAPVGPQQGPQHPPGHHPRLGQGHSCYPTLCKYPPQLLAKSSCVILVQQKAKLCCSLKSRQGGSTFQVPALSEPPKGLAALEAVPGRRSRYAVASSSRSWGCHGPWPRPQLARPGIVLPVLMV